MASLKKKKKSKKPLIIALLAVAVTAVAVFFVVFFFSGGDKSRVREQIDLGNKYLSELDYEQAVAAFEAALEIDPKSREAYEGLITAHGESGDLDEMVAAYEKASAQLPEEEIDSLRDVMADQIGSITERASRDGQYAAGLSVPASTDTITDDTRLRELLEELNAIIRENGRVRADAEASVQNPEHGQAGEWADPSEAASAPGNMADMEFILEGDWVSVGEEGFGQALPGELINFDGQYCNFISPLDEYVFYEENGEWYLECMSLENGESAVFPVEMIDEDYIAIYNGDQVTELMWAEYFYEEEEMFAGYDDVSAYGIPNGTWLSTDGFYQEFTFYGENGIIMSAFGISAEGTYEIRDGRIIVTYEFLGHQVWKPSFSMEGESIWIAGTEFIWIE